MSSVRSGCHVADNVLRVKLDEMVLLATPCLGTGVIGALHSKIKLVFVMLGVAAIFSAEVAGPAA